MVGAIALVHARDTMPFPEDYGIIVTPGVFNVISLRLRQINRAPAPYGDCIPGTTDTSDRNVYEEKFGAVYSKTVFTPVRINVCNDYFLMNQPTNLKIIMNS
jgi:hypothetical protein